MKMAHRLWEEPRASNLGAFNKRDRIVDIRTEVPHGVLNVRVPQQNQQGAKVARGLINQRCLRSTHEPGQQRLARLGR
jgi:hypothetical protein